MGRSRYRIYKPQEIHFLTNTIINWIPVFTRPATVQILLDSLNYLQQHSQLKLYGYVILENHMHWVAQSDDLSKDITRFKAHTARAIVKHLKEKRQKRILQQMAFYKKCHKKDRDYQCWEEGSHPEEIQGEEMMRQKLEYIHQNPVKRGYVDHQEDWRYSSARNYAGKEGLIDVVTTW